MLKKGFLISNSLIFWFLIMSFFNDSLTNGFNYKLPQLNFACRDKKSPTKTK